MAQVSFAWMVEVIRLTVMMYILYPLSLW